MSAPGIDGLRVGHAESDVGETGVTALIFDRPAPTVVDIRGGAPGTYNVASLGLFATFGQRLALFFSGGSLYGLDAARGIRTRILQSKGGVPVFGNPNRVVPISGAVLFDLPRKEGIIPDYLPLGYEAARIATRRVETGRVGAGRGAMVGKYLGRAKAMPGGVGWAQGRSSVGAVGVMLVLNSVGAIHDPVTGRWLAGARGPHRGIRPPIREPSSQRHDVPTGTTLGAVVTDLALARVELHRALLIATGAISRMIVPTATATDGDVFFAATTGRRRVGRGDGYPGALADRVGSLAASLVRSAILSAVREAHR